MRYWIGFLIAFAVGAAHLVGFGCLVLASGCGGEEVAGEVEPELKGATANMQMPELDKPATVVREPNGVPHIFAKTEHDGWFLLGYVLAEDRLFQMDVLRRQAKGTLAELLGPGALASDVQTRTLGFARLVPDTLAMLDTVEPLAAYADGINAFMRSGAPLPVEYRPLEITEIPPFTIEDLVTTAASFGFLDLDVADINATIALLTYQGTGEVVGFDGAALFFEDLVPARPLTTASTVPDASVPLPGKKFPKGIARRLLNMADANITDETLEMAKEFVEKMKKVPLFQHGDRGSNAWAVSGKHTLTGKPLVGGDGHLQATSPSIFYPAHVSFPGLNIQGVVVAGTGPGFPQGRNDHITWSSVHHRGDHTDFYQEQLVFDPSSPSNLSTMYQGELEHVIPIPDTYRYNVIGDGQPDNTEEAPAGTNVFGTEIPLATLIVPRHGPVVSIDMQAMSAISIQSTTLMPSRRNVAYEKLQKAKNFRQYEDALKLFGWGSYGFVYADERGNIAYNVAGDIPIREDLQAKTVNGLPPGFIRNGTGGNEWVIATDPLPYQSSKYELLPWEELPQILNPPAGFVVAANNDPAGVSLDNNLLNEQRPGGGIYYLSRSYGNSPRAARLTQMIINRIESSFPKLTLRYIQEMGASTVMIDAQIFVPYILHAYENATAAGADPTLAAVASDPRVAEAVARFRDWDFSSPTGIPEGYDASDDDGQLAEPTAEEIEASVACTIYSVTRGQMLKNTLDTVRNALMLPLADDVDFWGLVSVSALRHLLDNFDENQGIGESGLDFFNVPGVSDPAARRDILLLKSVADSLDLLASDAFAPAFNNSTDQNDYRWGRLHRIVIPHPLDGDFDVPPAFGAFPAPLADLAGIPTDGGFGTPDAGGAPARAEDADAFMWDVLGAQRYAYSMSKPWSRGKLAIPGGVSGNPFSPYYVNLLPQYLTNDYFPVIMPRRLPRPPHARSHR